VRDWGLAVCGRGGIEWERTAGRVEGRLRCVAGACMPDVMVRVKEREARKEEGNGGTGKV